MNNKIYDEWLKINVEIHNRLEALKKIDKEREQLLKEAEDKGLSEEIKNKMNDSLNKYNLLLEETRLLKLKSKKLKEEINC